MNHRKKHKTPGKQSNIPGGSRLGPLSLAPQRINRILSQAGLTSRRQADDWIRSGRITLNNSVIKELGTQAIWGQDSIKVDGKEIPRSFQRLYLMLNKPFGYVSSLKDPEGRPLVTGLLTGVTQRVYPVGRLDFDSLGLLLFTNDGEFAYRLTHPRYQVPRTYKATVRGEISGQAMDLLRGGIELEDGPSGPANVAIISRQEQTSIIRITITQGRSRQVRRMLEAVGYEVVQLMRTGFGAIRLGDLRMGRFRYLEKEEVASLKKMVRLA
jgi:23S rRNA pseudouridine2605 synthase